MAKTRKRMSPSAARKAYYELPVTESPCEFLKGYGNWGLTEAEYKKAKRLARLACPSKAR
jgi:hypothetical protein